MEAIKLFGFLFLWALASTVAALICTAIFALVWILMVHGMFRLSDRLSK